MLVRVQTCMLLRCLQKSSLVTEVCLSVCVSVTKISQEWMIQSLSNFQDIISGFWGSCDHMPWTYGQNKKTAISSQPIEIFT